MLSRLLVVITQGSAASKELPYGLLVLGQQPLSYLMDSGRQLIIACT